MMQTSRETAECLLAHAHALRLHAHRSLALSLTHRRGVDPRVATIAYGVVVLSLLVQGGLTGLLARRLRIGAGEWAGSGRSQR